MAEARSPQILRAQQAVAAADADVTGAGQRPNPTLAFATQGLSFWREPAPPFFDNQELSLTVEQEIETAGRRSHRTDTARFGADVARELLRDARRRLRLDVQRAYMQVALAKADDEVARATLADINQVLALNRARYEQGELSGVELRRLQVERFRFADDAFATELALKNARSELLALLNVEPLDRPFETTDGLGPPPHTALGGPAPSTAQALDQAFTARPDLAAARRDEERAGAAIRLQQALRRPSFTLGGGYIRDYGANGLVVTFGIPLPIFDRNQAGVARAAAEGRQASAETTAARIRVSLDVQEALNALDVASRRLAYVEGEYLTSAREARDITLSAYRNGAATLIDYLDAQRALRQALGIQNRARYDYRISAFQYGAAVGEGLDDLQKEQP